MTLRSERNRRRDQTARLPGRWQQMGPPADARPEVHESPREDLDDSPVAREVTAETLTNAEIAEVYGSAVGPGSHREADVDLMHACRAARNTYGDFTYDEQVVARITVASAFNARAKAGAK